MTVPLSDTASLAVGDLVAKVLQEIGVKEMVGVPDSQLRYVMAALPHEISVTHSVREDAAVAIAVGARLAGRRVGVFMKNAGIGTSADAIVSLLVGFRLSMPLVIGWSGSGSDHLVHHRLMGSRTIALLDALGIESIVLKPGAELELLASRVKQADHKRRSVALLVVPQ